MKESKNYSESHNIKKKKVNALDIQILKELNENSRKSIREISKTIDAGKSKVAYRMKQLEKSELIKFKTLINTKIFKLERVMLLIQINNTKTEKDLLDHWNSCPFVLNAYPLLGYRYSMALVLIAPKIEDFRIFINECEPGTAKDVFAGHILIPIISSNLDDRFLFEPVNFLNNRSDNRVCDCKGCNEFWNEFLNKNFELIY